MRHPVALPLLVLGISYLPLSAQAQWQVNGVPICTAARYQSAPKIVSDGAGGAIVAWRDDRTGSGYHIYAQRVDASGVRPWTANGVALCTAPDEKSPSGIVSDGAGGAIVTWEDYRSGYPNSDIYVQRVNASGIPQWTTNGVVLCTAAANEHSPAIVSDDAGGAIVTWYDNRSGANDDIYAQRVNASGVPQWMVDGVALCTDTTSQDFPTIASDGAGGAIVTWTSGPAYGYYDIYAQHVDALGVTQWMADGVALCTAANDQYVTGIVSDGVGGAIVTWPDYRSGTSDIYAQRVSLSGVPQWTGDGIVICTATGYQAAPTIVSDSAGGAIVTWSDSRNGGFDIYAQRVNDSGMPQWTTDGVALCTAAGEQFSQKIDSDGAGGAIVTWRDERNGSDAADIYAQRVSASGAPQWIVDGVAACTAADVQSAPRIVSDGAGGAIVTWQDDRSGGFSTDIYAQHVADPSNAVAIVSFDAVEVDGVVTLRSAFRSDLGVEAVNVYRGIGTDDDPLTIIERADDVRGDGFEYVDRDVAPGQTYRYQIGVVDADGEFFSPIVTVSVDAIARELEQNRPNPFNPTTTIRFVLPAREDVTLAIYDANGRLVRTLVNEVRGYGAHEVTWDGRDDDGTAVGSGVYFYRLHAGKLTESKKMVLLK